MEKRKSGRIYIGFFVLLVSAVFFFLLSLTVGTSRISVTETIQILMQHPADSASSRIIWDIRMPRALSAMILGGALSVAGYLLQSFSGIRSQGRLSSVSHPAQSFVSRS